MLKLLINAKPAIARLVENEDGQGLTEYGLILALIAVVAIVALAFLGNTVKHGANDGQQQRRKRVS